MIDDGSAEVLIDLGKNSGLDISAGANIDLKLIAAI